MRLLGSWDVAVVGAGPAGIAAAVASARNGARTVLVERYGFLGGSLTGALIAPFMTSFYGDRQVNRGIFQEVIDRLLRIEGTLGHMPCPYESGSTWGTGGSITLFDPEKMKWVLQQLAVEAGVSLVLHAQFADTIMHDDRLVGITALTKSGIVEVLANQIVDTTGDADVAARAGAPTQKGDVGGSMQPVSLFFHLAGVETAELAGYVRAYPEDFAWHTFPQSQIPIPQGLASEHVAGSGFLSTISEGRRNGTLRIGRERITFFTGLRPGHVIMNATRVTGIDGTEAEDMSKAEIEGREQAMSVTTYAREHFPGFQHGYMIASGVQVGIRETRHIVGEYVMSRKDVISGKKFKDTVAMGAFPVDIHEPGGLGNTWTEIEQPYGIPYRSLVPIEVDNLLVAGRAISGEHEAIAAFRVMPICFSTGEAAGTAAALAARTAISPRILDTEELRTHLLEQQMVLQ